MVGHPNGIGWRGCNPPGELEKRIYRTHSGPSGTDGWPIEIERRSILDNEGRQRSMEEHRVLHHSMPIHGLPHQSSRVGWVAGWQSEAIKKRLSVLNSALCLP